MKKTMAILLTCLLPAALPARETVVLLHGLARSSRSMDKMEQALTDAGYRVINHGYPSTSAPIETLAEEIFGKLAPQIAGATNVHFVTHSLGGILLRQHLENHSMTNLGRVVMLAPPSQGSEVADKLGWSSIYQWINGPAGNQLGTGTNSVPLRLQPPGFELGIIAGDRTINLILSQLIPGPDDGKVALARVRPQQDTDFIVLHTSHPYIMRNRESIQQTIHFLRHGHFAKKPVPCPRCLVPQ